MKTKIGSGFAVALLVLALLAAVRYVVQVDNLAMHGPASGSSTAFYGH